MPRNHHLPLNLLLGTAALACTARPIDEAATDATADPTTSAAQPTTALPDSTTGSTSSTGADAGSTAVDSTTSGDIDSTSSGATDPPDLGAPVQACDAWLPNCPEGQKCAAASLDGDSLWESLVCVPVVRDPVGVNEPCEDLGAPFDGLDTCAEGHMCWNVDPDTRLGICFAQCSGEPEDPHCEDPTALCLITHDATIVLCLPQCDPLLQDCPGEDLCLSNGIYGDGDTFSCFHDASGEEGQAFDPCAYYNVCDRGLFCAAPTLASECDPDGDGCCLPFCDLTAPLACPGAGQQCLPWFEDGAAPPQYQNVGLCSLPP